MSFSADNNSDSVASHSSEIAAAEYFGKVNTAFQSADVQNLMPDIQQRLQNSDAELIAGGRNQNIRINVSLGGESRSVLVKWFGKQSSLKDRADLAHRKSKAHRSFLAAMHLQANDVKSPAPIAYFEKIKAGRLEESYYLSLFETESTSFHGALLFLLHNQATASDLMPLLEQVALLCRGMHDAGFMHNDLGNQNILLRPISNRCWSNPSIIDLNRGRIYSELSLQQRGKDLSRLSIPSNLMAMFLDMYWGAPAPQDLLRSYQRSKKRFNWRAKTRSLRHPFREARIARESAALPPSSFIPQPKDLWIWDDTSDQALSPLDRNERVKQYPAGRSWRLLSDTLFAGFRLWRDYKKTKKAAFADPIEMRDRVGLAIAPTAEFLEQEIALLQELGPIPVLIRCCHHESDDHIAFQVDLIRRLSADGHAITLALLQDRRAILEPASWEEFVTSLLSKVASHIECIEYGHAINRVKWGIWSFSELRQFYAPLKTISNNYSELKIIGPATIDFEYPFLLSALRCWPFSVPMAALSHHLYVDRRGAPENHQNGFSALEKFALAKSIARTESFDSAEVIVSEVNWPIADTGVYSPVTAPFDYRNAPPGSLHDSGVSESNYADYMVRYLALSLCSGLVGRVFWWRLVARGYGLVDIKDNKLRERPAYLALRQFIKTLNTATFVQAVLPDNSKGNEGRYLIKFQRDDGEILYLSWQHGPAASFPQELNGSHFQDCLGNTLTEQPVELQGSPVYIRQCT